MSTTYEVTVTMSGGNVVAGKRTEVREFETLNRAMQSVVERRYVDDCEFEIRTTGYPAVLVSGRVDNFLLNPAQDAIESVHRAA